MKSATEVCLKSQASYWKGNILVERSRSTMGKKFGRLFIRKRNFLRCNEIDRELRF